jgi:hypothetical protein
MNEKTTGGGKQARSDIAAILWSDWRPALPGPTRALLCHASGGGKSCGFGRVGGSSGDSAAGRTCRASAPLPQQQQQ